MFFFLFFFTKIYIEVLSGSAKAPVSPVLGQYGINAVEFSNTFNKVSLTKYVLGVPLVVMLNIKSRGIYDFKIKVPSLKLFLDSISIDLDNVSSEYFDIDQVFEKKIKKKFIEKKKVSINILELYDVCLILSDYYEIDVWRMSKIVLGYLYSKKSYSNIEFF